MSSTQSLGDGDLLSMLLSVLSDVRQELARVAASNTELREQVRKLTEKVEPPKNETAKDKRRRLEMEAIRKIEDCGPCVVDIAAAIGVPENTLHGWKVFKTAIKREIAKQEALRKQAQEDKENGWLGQSW